MKVSFIQKERERRKRMEWMAGINWKKCLQMPKKRLCERIAIELYDVQVLNGLQEENWHRNSTSTNTSYESKWSTRGIMRCGLYWSLRKKSAFSSLPLNRENVMAVRFLSSVRRKIWSNIAETSIFAWLLICVADGQICNSEVRYVALQGKKLCLTEWAKT